MPLPAPGQQISFSTVNTELGRSASAQFSLSDPEFNTLAGTTPGQQISFSSAAGGRARINIVISSNVNSYNLLSQCISTGNYSAGKTWVTVTINNGVVVGGGLNGLYSFVINGFTEGDLIQVINNGYIVGQGGLGGRWTDYVTNTNDLRGVPGELGGNALYVSHSNTFITNNGVIAGGGGGGASGLRAGSFNSKFRAINWITVGGTGGSGAGSPITPQVSGVDFFRGSTFLCNTGSIPAGSLTTGTQGGLYGVFNNGFNIAQYLDPGKNGGNLGQPGNSSASYDPSQFLGQPGCLNWYFYGFGYSTAWGSGGNSGASIVAYDSATLTQITSRLVNNGTIPANGILYAGQFFNQAPDSPYNPQIGAFGLLPTRSGGFGSFT